MRTALDIDLDVLNAAKKLERSSHRTAGQVISEWARQALGSTASTQSSLVEWNGFEILPAGGSVVTPELVRKLMTESE